ncbi:SMC-Scp complex subunit ScpB [Lacticaseibacillus manihotivorans]|jgi:segregation and condensation protein B|uniref:Segregation and condensation protein B n=2 Tax=Lacticaseibacillus manihotivorans TaxID=88233 RepID=A0A0R1QRZ7_9LACO|nr:SMC-Scp complex subunit ScpB [Lacticaseibacillus manihotivorans]KRL43971.1 segregation and condensation protein B [Lacticaseibacillus manihotivorans DSM 13343 = JCM 12514]QFQ91274.1 SMC-Scp complex subunit ScpB [Lacticaseibacillus manihotivorans]
MQGVIEAVLYTAGTAGVELQDFAGILGISTAAMRQQLEAYQKALAEDANAGLFVRQSADRYYLLTKPEFADALRKYFAGPPAQGLSQAALEVLAIIAYQQPITRIEIDEVRGVQSSGALTTLASRQLVKEAGRKEAPGRPILYATTPLFLDYFGLKTLKDLPPLEEHQAASEIDLFDFNSALEGETNE